MKDASRCWVCQLGGAAVLLGAAALVGWAARAAALRHRSAGRRR